MKTVLRLLLPVSICLSIACGRPGTPLNVVLIGVDTLRPDHMGCYGYDRNTMPNVDQLASEGVLFENVIAPSSWTLPSFATVFTSLYPAQHGATHFYNSIFKIDGRAATERTFMGSALRRPVTMPFTDRDSPDDGSGKAEPDGRPRPPYFLVWLSKAGFEGESAMDLDDETEKELRSLGYIQ
jgi:hypothetical protein